MLGGEKINHLNDCILLPNLLKLRESGVIVQIDELHKISDCIFYQL